MQDITGSAAEIKSPLPGDIILSASTGLARYMNMRAQGLVGIQYSHAMLVVSDMTVVHAMIDTGTIESDIWSMIGDSSVMRWRVIRNDQVAAAVLGDAPAVDELSLESRLQKSARRRVGVEYNKLFYFARLLRMGGVLQNADALFCSQLVAVVFDELRLPLSSREHDRVFPRQLKNLAFGPGWRDVTLRYWGWYQGNVKVARGFDAPQILDPGTFRS